MTRRGIPNDFHGLAKTTFLSGVTNEEAALGRQKEHDLDLSDEVAQMFVCTYGKDVFGYATLNTSLNIDNGLQYSDVVEVLPLGFHPATSIDVPRTVMVLSDRKTGFSFTCLSGTGEIVIKTPDAEPKDIRYGLLTAHCFAAK